MPMTDATDSGHEALVEQLREALGAPPSWSKTLSTTLATAAAREPSPRVDWSSSASSRRRASTCRSSPTRLVDTEHQLDRLMSLYVATYQLHAYLDPRQVHGAIAEIAVNLLGAERFALLLREEGATSCQIALSEGVVADATPLFAGASYPGGDPLVDPALVDGALRLGPLPGSSAVAAVPLKIQDEVVGALVVLKLFDHKPGLRPDDRDLLDLLSANAASALFAARLFAAKDRKLRTLESLVRLARSGS